MKTVEHLFELTGMNIEDVAEKAGLQVERVAAIAEGRWTPSPDERAGRRRLWRARGGGELGALDEPPQHPLPPARVKENF